MQVAYAWAANVGIDQGAAILANLDLLEAAVDAAIAEGQYQYAEELASAALPEKVRKVHLIHATAMEEQGVLPQLIASFPSIAKFVIANT
jgi:hypothetical protein